MWIKLSRDASVPRVRAQLQLMGLWASPMKTSDGDVEGLIVQPHSNQVDAMSVQAIDGVAQVCTSASSHPAVDAQAHRDLVIGDLTMGQGHAPVLMAGPCSVESEAQIHDSAAMVAEAGARVLRGGVFKPRTSPYAFSGVGDVGLRWMREAADAHKLLMLTEVLSEAEVENVARWTDLFQIGSRNMQNYALLAAVGRMGKPVLLKRGMSAFVNDWLLAGEHLLAAGSGPVIFCERGLRGFDSSTRNLLDLSAVALLKHVYGQPVVVDPSHAVGRRDLILPMTRAALGAGADGVLVESHPEPSQALSDGPQALHPSELQVLSGALSRWQQMESLS